MSQRMPCVAYYSQSTLLTFQMVYVPRCSSVWFVSLCVCVFLCLVVYLQCSAFHSCATPVRWLPPLTAVLHGLLSIERACQEITQPVW